MDIFEKQIGLIEAVLFLENEPTSEGYLMKISGLSRREIKDALEKIKTIYSADSHGIELVKLGGGYFFTPKQELADYLRPHYGKRGEGKISRAALETLSIIAYSQPVTRAEIESIRGVSADNMIKLLLKRNLIKEVGKKDAPGKPTQYGTTKEFLLHFKLESISDLPKLDEVEVERFRLK